MALLARYRAGKSSRTAALPVLLGLGACASAALLYFYPPDRYGFYPVCPIHQMTGLWCPGCGATRALAALLQGDPALAFRYNALVPVLLACAVLHVVVALGRGRSFQLPRPVLTLALAACAVFTLLRNVP